METVKVTKLGRVPKDRQFILSERAKIIFERVAMGFQRSDVAEMVNVHPAYVTRLLEERADEYRAVAAKVAGALPTIAA